MNKIIEAKGGEGSAVTAGAFLERGSCVHSNVFPCLPLKDF